MSKLSDPWTSRQQRHLAFISEFSTDIRHVSGKSNVVADCLSRAALSNVVLGIDYDAMAKAQTEDKDVKAFPTAITGLRIMPFQINNSTLLCDVSTGHPRPLVPRSFQRHVFATIHNLAHPDELPWVLLGLRTAPKEDFGLSAAELVYGIPLSVPGEFIDPTSKTVNAYAPNDPFSSCVQRLSPFPTSHHGLTSSSSVPQSLRDSKFVFIRNDSHRGPLRRPYDGPFRVVAPGDKTFRIMVGSREEVISADRLKPAYVDLTGPVTVAQPPRRGRPPLEQAEPTNQENAAELESSPPRQQSRSTRSGRAVHLPPRFR
ncbi:Pol polyprotein [Plakobranchus ocellatus]|uniref:Pol polyprotein n=1 Tax=Plakobranchus ocellatus TaxID=259542 RepID=A0AAV4AW55_9GAST|nr:Pol polyprotein [Plakobranchus ocellatus]